VLEVQGGELVVRNVPVPESFGAARSGTLRTAVRRLGLARLLTGGEPQGEGPAANPASREVSAFGELAEAIFSRLRDTCSERGADFAIVYLPPGPLYATGEVVPPVLEWLGELGDRLEIPFYDLTPAFAGIPPEELAAHFSQRHYSPAGNRVVAEALDAIIARDFDRGAAEAEVRSQ
jgi:lysophospholipase L1-like esterase